VKIAIIGATGGIGQKVVEQALEKGHQVIAISRKAPDLALTHERLEKRAADVLDKESIKKGIEGAEAIVSSIGTSVISEPTMLCSDGTRNIIDAMHSSGTKRLIAVGASGYVDHPRQTFLVNFLQKYIVQKILRNIFDDLKRMESIINNSGLDWTVVRPPRLTGGKHTGRYRVQPELVRGGLSISRSDVADFIIGHLTDTTIFQKAIAIAY